MATITKRNTGWFVQVRRKGYEPEYRTFRSKVDAQKWARDREARIDRGDLPAPCRELRSITLGDLIKRYVEQVTPTKRGASTERLRLVKMALAAMCQQSLLDLTSASIASYRDARLQEVKPATVIRELNLIRRVIEVAKTDWGLGIASNVAALVRKPIVNNFRDRRLRHGEIALLVSALDSTRNALIRPAVMIAIETALRRGEILSITWDAVDYEARTIHIPNTKSGHARTIPMTDEAVRIFRSLPVTGHKVFPISATALRLAWNRVRERASVPDLRFHDLRHEAISRFAEMGLTTMELAAISGHRDLRMLSRYTHIQPSALARKLAGRSWENEVGIHTA